MKESQQKIEAATSGNATAAARKTASKTRITDNGGLLFSVENNTGAEQAAAGASDTDTKAAATSADATPGVSRAKLTVNALKVLERRYLKKDDNNNVTETADDMFHRVANNIAQADLNYDANADLQGIEEKFFTMMADLDFLPNSPTLMNAGRDLQQLSACFVLPIDDTMEDIFETVKNTALIHKSGGGTGFSFSRLRPKDSRVRSTKGASSGPVSFMSVFNAATEIIKQGGTRRGANMGILRVDHPDILGFIKCKQEDGKLSNFNISVALTDEFMQAVEAGTSYPLRDPRDKSIVDEMDARTVFDMIVASAHRNGEPGIIFLDAINRDNPTPHVGDIESTNPCGEQPLLPYESCNLGSINLSRFVTTDKKVDYDRLKTIVHTSTHFLDNVIDMNRYPLPSISEMTRSNRKIGLGLMGFADMLIHMDIPYESEEAYAVAEEVMGFIQKESKAASVELAKKRGAFPNFKGSVYDVPGQAPIRNATTTTIAPTGTISIIASCSSGIEPLFAVSYVRTVMDKDELIEVHPHFREVAKEQGFFSPDMMKRISSTGSLHGIEEIPEGIRNVFVTAHDISPESHIRMQAAFQLHTDNAVSKTVNFKNSASVEDVENVYRLAYKLQCKGVTIYRDGSRKDQVLSVQKPEEAAAAQAAAPAAVPTVPFVDPSKPRERPAVTTGRTERIITGCGNLYVTVNADGFGPCEVFTQMGKCGGCAASQSEAISRLISLCLRSGIQLDQIVKHLRGIRCHTPSWQDGGMITSCADALGLVLERFMRWNQKHKSDDQNPEPAGKISAHSTSMLDNLVGACPDCGGVVEHEGGCAVCRLCGFSRCA